jgi:uncharacterized protein YuzE
MKRKTSKLIAMLVTYDSSADALYIYVHRSAEVARSVLVDDERTVDLDASDKVVGIEILAPSAGFELEDIIQQFDLQELRDDLLQAAQEFRPAATA